MKRWTGIWVAAGVLAVTVGGGLVYLRTQKVISAAADPGLRTLLEGVLDPAPGAPASSPLPWETADLTWDWAAPSLGAQLPEGTFAWQPLGLLRAAGTPPVADAQTWWSALRARPLALAGRGDDELVAALCFAADQALPPGSLGPLAAVLSSEPGLNLGPDGLLAGDHPWKPAVEVLRSWKAQGLLVPDWSDWSGEDAAAAVAEGRAGWAVVTADKPFLRSGTGIRTTTLSPLPVPAGRRAPTAFGKAIVLKSGTGWAADNLVGRVTSGAASSEAARLWLVRGGFVLTGDQPAVDQESKALALNLRSAGSFVVLPSSPEDLARVHALLEVVRTELRR